MAFGCSAQFPPFFKLTLEEFETLRGFVIKLSPAHSGFGFPVLLHFLGSAPLRWGLSVQSWGYRPRFCGCLPHSWGSQRQIWGSGRQNRGSKRQIIGLERQRRTVEPQRCSVLNRWCGSFTCRSASVKKLFHIIHFSFITRSACSCHKIGVSIVCQSRLIIIIIVQHFCVFQARY